VAIGKLEGEIVISTATVIGTFAGVSITMPVGNYFLNSIGNGGATRTFLLELKYQLDTNATGTWTVTCDDDTDAGTGKITIARNSVFTMTWTSSTLRDLLGFTTGATTVTTMTGDYAAQYLFMPDCGRSGVLAPESSDGAIEADHTISIAPDGTCYSLAYSQRYFDTLEFAMLSGQKTWTTHAVYTNDAYQKFYEQVIGRAKRVRYYPDRSVDSTYRTWYVEDAGHFDPKQVSANWVGTKSRWSIGYRVRKTS